MPSCWVIGGRGIESQKHHTIVSYTVFHFLGIHRFPYRSILLKGGGHAKIFLDKYLAWVVLKPIISFLNFRVVKLAGKSQNLHSNSFFCFA